MSTQERYCEDRSYTIECPDLNAFALHEKEHSSYPAVGHFSYVIPLSGLKELKLSYQKQQHPAGISLIVSLENGLSIDVL